MTEKKKSRFGCLVRFLILAGVTILVGALLVLGVIQYLNPPIERENGIVYTERNGRELTMDWIRPSDPNGKGIVLILSGRWKSKPDYYHTWIVAPLLRKGFTILAVSHLPQPEASVMEIEEDMNRAVRFIRSNATRFKIDPNRLGAVGASAGGHLALLLITRGGPGDPENPDPVERESSAIQAAGIFFPVTNLVDLGTSTENAGDEGPPKSFRKAFGPDAMEPEKWKVIAHELSPVFHVYEEQSPVLIFHGDVDKLTPLEQSEWFVEAAEKEGASVELVVKEGGDHGWYTMTLDIRRMADWFEERL